MFRLTLHCPPAAAEWLRDSLTRRAPSGFEELAESEEGVGFRLYGTERAALEQQGSELSAFGGAGGQNVRWRVEAIDSDWATRWTEYLQPVQITRQLRLVPVDGQPMPQQGCLWLKRGMAFGFGEHATTRLMARWLQLLCQARPGVRVLDVGSGTGVLSLVALASGAGSSVGVEIEPDALRNACENARLNGFERRARFGSAFPGREKFDVVVANIELNVLLELSRRIVRCAGTQTEFAFAGVLTAQVQDLVRVYDALGVQLGLQDTEDDWCLVTGSLTRSSGIG